MAPENARKRAAIHSLGAHVGENALVVCRKILPKPFRHDELQDSVAQKLKPLVIGDGGRTFLRKGTMRQRLNEEFPVGERMPNLGFDLIQISTPRRAHNGRPILAGVGGAVPAPFRPSRSPLS